MGSVDGESKGVPSTHRTPLGRCLAKIQALLEELEPRFEPTGRNARRATVEFCEGVDMGIFNHSRSRETSKRSATVHNISTSTDSENRSSFQGNWVDERTAECPYCRGVLKKIPGAKTKCPHCSKYMFVRNDPRSRSQRVVTEEEIELIDDERAKIGGYWPERLAEKKRHEELKAKLRIQWGQEPSPDDVQWGLWNQDLVLHASNRDWGLYRNTLLSMAQNSFKRGIYDVSLMLFMDVMYLDGCGPANGGRGWRADERMYLAYIAGEIVRNCKKLNLTENQVLEQYAGRGITIQQSLRMPDSFVSVWARFRKETDFRIT